MDCIGPEGPQGLPGTDGSDSYWLANESNIYYNLGDVGIGTTSPNYELDVNGDINFIGNLYKNGSLFEVSSGDGIGGIDSNTKLLLHMDDEGLSDSSIWTHSVTKYEDVTRTNVQNKFGGYSAYFDGDWDYLEIPDSEDWNFGNGDFTIEMWLLNPDGYMLSQGHWTTDIQMSFALSMFTDGVLFFRVSSDGNTVDLTLKGSHALSANNWHHIAVVRSGDIFNMYLDGTLEATGIYSNAIHDSMDTLLIGSVAIVSNDDYDGYIDELRISKGIARWTSDFTPPTAPYDAGGSSLWAVDGDDIFRETGYVGIGTTTPITELEVNGTVTATTFSGLMDWPNLINIPAGFSDDTDNVDDADSDPENELNTSVALNGTNLEITDAGGTLRTDLSSLGLSDTDWAESEGNVYREAGNVGIGTNDPKAKLEVTGAIKIGSSDTCDADTEGSIRYNFTNKIMEFCNGTEWKEFGTSVPIQPAHFGEIQSIPTNGALDWESFVISGETYLAVTSYRDGTNYNIDSRIYKWNGSSFVEIQAIPTNSALDWESFVISGETYLAVANHYNGSSFNIDSKIYKWNGSSFVEIQAIPTNTGHGWESFIISGETYLAVANSSNGSTHNIDSRIYKWNGSSFAEIQAIPTNGVHDWESFIINDETYLAVANSFNGSTHNIDSRIYKWNGSSFVEIQAIPTNAAHDWESFIINDETYLAVANSSNDSTYNIDSRIYKWNGSSFVEIQSILTYTGCDWESFIINGETFLAVANFINDSNYNIDSRIYKVE